MTAASETPQLRIRGAADLFTALSDPDIGVRLAVLQGIARQPAATLAYGAHAGRDVVDELIRQLESLLITHEDSKHKHKKAHAAAIPRETKRNGNARKAG